MIVDPAIQILPNPLPHGNVGSPYSQQLSMSGGEAPFTFEAVDTPPAWLTLTPEGLLSGTPTEEGSFPFRVKGTDKNGLTVYQMM